MSKNRHRAISRISPRTEEKYIQTLIQSDSDDTIVRPRDNSTAMYSDPTDAPLRDDILPTRSPEENRFVSSLKKAGINILIVFSILGGIALIVGVVLFFWGMNNSVESTKTNLEKVDAKVENLYKESRDTKVSLAIILEKFDRLFDNAQKIKR